MPSRSLQTDAFVLSSRRPADAFQTFTVFSALHGILLVLQRVPRRASEGSSTAKPAAGGPTLDLFDEASLILESSNQGRTWFVKEARILKRAEGIGRDYTRLQFACRLAKVVERNPVDDEARAGVAELLRTALTALAAGADPGIVFFKSLYRFARDEGHPVKQQWLAELPETPRLAAEKILSTPLASLEVSSVTRKTTEQLQRRLDDYLRGHTEILLD